MFFECDEDDEGEFKDIVEGDGDEGDDGKYIFGIGG